MSRPALKAAGVNEIKVPQLAESLKGVGLKRHVVGDCEREGWKKKKERLLNQ